jgi:hypothetical protein
MKKTVITTIQNDPELEALCRQLEQRRQETQERLKFLEKQMKDVVKARDAQDKAEWEKIEALLRQKDLLKDYDTKTQHLELKFDQNALYLCDHGKGGGKHPLAAFFAPFFED